MEPDLISSTEFWIAFGSKSPSTAERDVVVVLLLQCVVMEGRGWNGLLPLVAMLFGWG